MQGGRGRLRGTIFPEINITIAGVRMRQRGTIFPELDILTPQNIPVIAFSNQGDKESGEEK